MPKLYKRNCDQCGQYYEGRGQYYCSKQCQGLSDRKYRSCIRCGKPYRPNHPEQKFCSRRCFADERLVGRPKTPEHAEAISKALKGRRKSRSHRRKLSAASKRIFRDKTKHPRWKGGPDIRSCGRCGQSFWVTPAKDQEYCSRLCAIESVGAFGHREIARDGHVCFSASEVAIDNWLFENGLEHEIEPDYPYPIAYRNPKRADWRIGDVYIEFWGVTNVTAYDEKIILKRTLARQHGITLIELYPADLTDLDAKLGHLRGQAQRRTPGQMRLWQEDL